MSDQYHTHAAEEGAPQLEDGSHVSPKALGITLIIMVFGVLALIFILNAYFNTFMSNYDKRTNETSEAAAASFTERQEVFAAIGIDDNGDFTGTMATAVDQVITEYASN